VAEVERYRIDLNFGTGTMSKRSTYRRSSPQPSEVNSEPLVVNQRRTVTSYVVEIARQNILVARCST
jgi:hypothetical protein